MALIGRRAFLGSLAAAGLASCGRQAPRRLAGGIVGGGHARGHRLRDRLPADVPEADEEAAVAVVGAGIAGLSAAWTLRRAGVEDVIVLELEDVPGGTARSGTGPVSPYPWGAHYVPVPDAANRPLLALLREVGAVTGEDAAGRPVFAEDVLCRAPEERVFYRGQWYEGLYPRVAASRRDLDEMDAFEAAMRRFAGWRDGAGRRAFAIPRAASADAAELRGLDGLSMAAWMDREGLRSERLLWLVDYACRDDFGTTASQTSAWAGIHYWASRIHEGEDEPAEILTWPEGNGRLVAHLAGPLGPRLRTGALVHAVAPGGDGVVVGYLDEAGRSRALRAQRSIVALPAFLLPRVVLPWRDAPPPWLSAFGHGCWMVANLTLSDRPASRGFPLSWDNVLYGSPSLGYVTATHQAGVDHGPTVLTYYRPFTGDDPAEDRRRALETSWESWCAGIVEDLRPAHPGIEGLIERIDVYLWGHAMVRPVPGLMWSDALARAAEPLGAIHFAHTDLSGMALFEEAQHHGVRAATEVLAAMGAAVPAW